MQAFLIDFAIVGGVFNKASGLQFQPVRSFQQVPAPTCILWVKRKSSSKLEAAQLGLIKTLRLLSQPSSSI